MQTDNIHVAKTQLPRLIEQSVKMGFFYYRQSWKATGQSNSAGQIRRLGFMASQITVPDDFDRMGDWFA